MTGRRAAAFRRLARIEGERRARAATGEARREDAVRRDIALHDAVRLLDLVPAEGLESGYDARDSRFRYRIAGCTPADFLVAAEAFRSGSWDRGLLVSMTSELEPLAIDELTCDAVRSTPSAALLRAYGRRRWSRE